MNTEQFILYCKDNVRIYPYNSEIGGAEYVLQYKNGNKIHIKKKNIGTFTKYCNGNVTEACILKGKNSKDPKIRKKAIFAQNSRKWNHGN